MVGQPVPADDEHAQAVAQERAALVLDEVPELTIDLVGRAVEVRELEVQDEQRDRDREDAVAERDDAGRRRAWTARTASCVRPPIRRDYAGMSPRPRTSSRSATSSSVVIRMRSLAKSSCSMPSTTFQLVPSLAHREAELQTLGRAVLAAARDRERVPVAGRRRLPDAVDRVDRRVRGATPPDDAPRASMTAAPRFWTVSMNWPAQPVGVADDVGRGLAADLARARSRGTGWRSGCPRSRRW